LTNGRGVDLAIEVAGPKTLNDSLAAWRLYFLMGVLTGFTGQSDTAAILSRRITLQRTYVGPVAALKALTRVPMKPLVDQVFEFGNAGQAYDSLRSAQHFGKIVIRIGR
jgi:NADPH:quinone reductase-like Zn-dependent oxidoreductase